jgi:hypothetical protein
LGGKVSSSSDPGKKKKRRAYVKELIKDFSDRIPLVLPTYL